MPRGLDMKLLCMRECLMSPVLGLAAQNYTDGAVHFTERGQLRERQLKVYELEDGILKTETDLLSMAGEGLD